MEATIADKAVLYFNQALIHMRLHQYKHATFLLEQLFQVHNTLHSELLIAVRVSHLLIQCMVCMVIQ